MRGNTVSIVGNITRDAEVQQTQSGSIIARWGIAWNMSKKQQDGSYVDVPHYFDVACWLTDRQLQYIEPLLVKGARCAIVDGSLRFNSWETDNGEKRSKVSIMVDDPINGMSVTAPRQSNGGSGAQPTNYPSQQQTRPQTASQRPVNNQYNQAYNQQYPTQNYEQMPYMGAPAASTPGLYDEDIPF